jgi:DNA-binding SARP family transcriptional activator/tetratricopeptide (TPR) repeat protein
MALAAGSVTIAGAHGTCPRRSGLLVVQLLGPVRVWRDGHEVTLGPPGRRAVFGILALSAGQPVTRQELIDALWGEEPPAGATNVLQTHVKHLRRVLEPERGARTPSELVPAVGDGYRLRLPDGALDLLRFRALVRAAEGRTGEQRAAALGEALALAQGEPLADVPALAGHPRTVALRAELRHALARYGDTMIVLGRASSVLPHLVRDAAAHPLDESAQARLIRAYQAAGQRAEAFEVYQVTRRRLAGELGVDPGPELVTGHQHLIGAAPKRSAPATEARSAEARSAEARSAEVRPAKVPRQLPAGSTAFTGRDEELAQLGADPGVAVLLICGTAGVGKTALAVHWSRRVQDRFPDGQLYLDLRGYAPERPVQPAEALGRLLAALGDSDVLPLDPDLRGARFRSAVAGRRLLIMLDNAASVQQVRPLLPGTPGAVVVVTSRERMGGLVAVDGARRLELAPLTEHNAVRLLHRLVGERVSAEPAAAAALAGLCARLPLALRVAAERAAARSAQPLASLVADLTDRRRRLDLLDPGGDPRAAVREVISYSYQQLDADTARTFRLLGLHPGEDIDAGAAAALTGLDRRRAGAALEGLLRASLGQRTGADRLGLHDLVRDYAAELTARDTPATRQAALRRLLDHYASMTAAAHHALYPSARGYLHGVPDSEPADVGGPDAAQAWLEAEHSNLRALCEYAARHGWPDHAVTLATHLRQHLQGGHHTDALAIQSVAIEAAREVGDARAEAHLRTNLGDIYRLLGQYALAVGEHRAALALHEQTGDRTGQARTLTDLGIVAERLGDHEAAVRRHEAALELHRAVGDRYGEAAVLVNVGNVLTGRARHKEAADAFSAAYEIFGGLGERAGQAVALTNLGETCTNLGDYPQAARRLDAALALFRELGHRDGEATVLANLGNVHTRLGVPDKAIDCLRAALETFRATGHRYGEASVHNGLGEALRSLGRTGEALAEHRDALAIAADTGDRDEQARAERAIAALR